jgi:hypothetical protein
MCRRFYVKGIGTGENWWSGDLLSVSGNRKMIEYRMKGKGTVVSEVDLKSQIVHRTTNNESLSTDSERRINLLLFVKNIF